MILLYKISRAARGVADGGGALGGFFSSADG